MTSLVYTTARWFVWMLFFEMQDPRNDVKHVIRCLVCRPRLQEQAETLRRHFTPDVNFYHFYINIAGGRADLTAIYQMAELIFNYQAVRFHDVVYDDTVNALAVHMTVYIRPWLSFYREFTLVFFTLLELEDHTTPDGKVVKLIKVQRDYFDRSPIVSTLPLIGALYNSHRVRLFLGRTLVLLFKSLRYVTSTLLLRSCRQYDH